MYRFTVATILPVAASPVWPLFSEGHSRWPSGAHKSADDDSQLYLGERERRLKRLKEIVHRAFAEFLKLPVAVIAGFLLLAAATSMLDSAGVGWIEPARTALRERFFRDSQTTSDLLATVAGSIITVTSITFSLLLLAVQQAAASLTHQVYDQFLRRRINQVYFGFFIGLAIYTLIVLASVDQPFNPVLGATVALLLTIIALTLMILLLYTTINQMRPAVVIEAIHEHILTARKGQRAWLCRMRPAVQRSGTVPTLVPATAHGYVVRVDLDALEAAAQQAGSEVEILLSVSFGSFVAFGDTLAEVRSASPSVGAETVNAVRAAVCLEQQRNLLTDAAYGIEQLSIIAWTSISTAKSNPSPGLLVLHSLRDVLARWSAEESGVEGTNLEEKAICVIYSDDVFAQLLDAFENLAVVASESMQPQTAAEIYRTFAIMFDRLPLSARQRAEDLIRRSLSALGEHVLTAELNTALSDLANSLHKAGHSETAAEVSAAQQALSASVGRLRSRATRGKA